MPIGKMDLQLIDDEKTRRLTFERRKKCLFKKAYELSVLCEVEVCVVVSGCLSADQRNDQWQTWPENLGEVGRMIRKFEVKKSSKTMANASNALVQRQENVGAKSVFPLWDSRIDSFSLEGLYDLLEILDKKSAAVDVRMTALRTTQVDELPMINFTVNGLPTGQSEMDWIDNLNLDLLMLPDLPLEDDLLFDELPMQPSKETLESEKFQSLPEPDNQCIAVNLPMEPYSEKRPIQPEHTCCLKEMEYYSMAAGEPSQWSSLTPLPHSIASWPHFPPNNDGFITNEIQFTPMYPELEMGVERPDHTLCVKEMDQYSMALAAPSQWGSLPPLYHSNASWPDFPLNNDECVPNQFQCIPMKPQLEMGVEQDGLMEQVGYYSIGVDAGSQASTSELPPLPYASTSAPAFVPPIASYISWPAFCGGDYHSETRTPERKMYF